MATASPATRVAAELDTIARGIGIFDSPVTPEQVLEEGVRSRHGMLVQVFTESPQPWDPVVSDLGFTPTVSVMFRLDTMREISDQQDDMIRLTSALLNRIAGDAVLEFQSEEIWLLRRNGDLSVHERDDLWPQHRLALLSQPHERVTHTFSED